MEDDRQAGRIERGPSCLGEPEHPDHHRGHEVESADVELFDQVECSGGIESAHEMKPGAVAQVEEAVAADRGVVGRPGDELGAVALLLGVLGGVGVASIINMPQVESLANFTPGVITRLFDRTGEVFATYAKEKRVLIQEGEVPPLLQNAILAAEDSNFFQHGGIDAEGVLRAMTQNLRQGRLAMGGSTITMQLARQLYLTPKKTWQRKAEEALLAVELEKNFSKQQILTLYCNLIFKII